MEKAYLCPEGHQLLVNESINMNGLCPVCHTDYPLYLLTPVRAKKEDKVAEKKEASPKANPAKKNTAAKKPKPATQKAIAAGEKASELPAKCILSSERVNKESGTS
ncbi:MAG: hypothetical protein ACOXZX_00740 [Synergistaceae bacterium]